MYNEITIVNNVKIHHYVCNVINFYLIIPVNETQSSLHILQILVNKRLRRIRNVQVHIEYCHKVGYSKGRKPYRMIQGFLLKKLLNVSLSTSMSVYLNNVTIAGYDHILHCNRKRPFLYNTFSHVVLFKYYSFLIQYYLSTFFQRFLFLLLTLFGTNCLK